MHVKADVVRYLYTSLLGRRVAKRFVLNRRLCWFPGKINEITFDSQGLSVRIDFYDGDKKHYHSLLSTKVIVILPAYRSKYSEDSQNFLSSFYENDTSPYPRSGSTVFINHHGLLIKGYVNQYDKNTGKHEITICGSNELLHLNLVSKRGPRWFWFCDDDRDVHNPRTVLCKYKSKEIELLHKFKQIVPTYDERAMQHLIWQLSIWPLFMNQSEWTQYYTMYIDQCTNLMMIDKKMGNRLPKVILNMILTYTITVHRTNVKQNLLYHIW